MALFSSILSLWTFVAKTVCVRAEYSNGAQSMAYK